MQVLKKIIPFFVLIFILVIVELFSHFTLSQKNISSDLFYKKNVGNSAWCLNEGYAYTQIDPLLGWSIDYSKPTTNSYTQKFNSTLLSSLNIPCNDTIVIYISGGSTSDLTFDPNNWPKSLQKILNEHNLCNEIYVAAVAGYNSGQELLKSIRDINKIKPDIHISYSGVNEMNDPSFVSWYETQLINANLSGPKILPNTITLLERALNLNQSISFKNSERYKAVDFWEQNMKNMNGLAKENNYIFIGILQAVFNYSEHYNNIENEQLHYFANEYIRFFPEARNISLKEDYIFDFSKTFYPNYKEAFKDDCHLSDVKYQDIIGTKTFKLIDSLFIEKSNQK